MSFRAIAAVAGLGLLAGACSQPAPPAPAEPTPVADQPATPAAPDAFAYAVNYECEGGGVVDVVFNSGNGSDVLARLDGGAAETLPGNPDSQTGMEYKNATTTLQTDGSSVTWKSGATTKTCMIKTRELPAPTVAGVVRTLTATDAGASVDVKVGDKISVALVGVPTAGYVWGAASPPAFIKATDGPDAPFPFDALVSWAFERAAKLRAEKEATASARRTARVSSMRVSRYFRLPSLPVPLPTAASSQNARIS